MDKLVPSFKESLFAPTYELTAECAEIALDALFESDALKAIPVVSTITAICKVGYNIRERNLLRQTISFISEFNSGKIAPEKKESYLQMLNDDPARAEKELSRVLIILGNHIDEIQSAVLGSFYGAFVKGSISWDKFCELSEANRRMYVSDYFVLSEAAHNKGVNLKGRELYQVDRLVSLGLLQNQNRLGGSTIIDIDAPPNPNKDKDYIVTSFGRTFYQHMPIIRGVK